MRSRYASLLAGLALATLPALALATTPVGSVSYTINQPLTPNPWTASFLVPQFDSSGGKILTAVGLQLDTNIMGSVGLENLDAVPEMMQGTVAATVTASDGGALNVSAMGGNFDFFMAAPFDGVMDFSGSSGTTINLGASALAFGGTNTGLSAYVGSGNLTFTLTGADNSGGFSPGNYMVQAGSAADATLMVTYQYGVVPTPAAVLGGGMLLGLMGSLRRRRQA